MQDKVNQALFAAAVKLLKPLVRIFLRKGIPHKAMVEILKKVYVDVAADEFALGYKKQSASRIAVLTGLTRKEITKLRDTNYDDQDVVSKHNRAARVTTAWLRDERFADEKGAPALLDIEGVGKPTFQSLVKEFGGDVPHRAMLDELLRVGSIELLAGEKVKLKMRGYVPANGEEEKLAILGMDVKDLINTIDHNIENKTGESRLQLKVCYDNLPEDVLPKLRNLSSTKGQQFLEDLDQWLSAHDRNVNPEVKGQGRKRAGIGIYYFEEDFKEDDS